MTVTVSDMDGTLCIMTAALESRIICLATEHHALCDHETFLKKRVYGCPYYFYYHGTPDKKELKVAHYYDTANFSRSLKVPGWFSWWYNDKVCLPTSMYAAYNVITSSKELHSYLEIGHYGY